MFLGKRFLAKKRSRKAFFRRNSSHVGFPGRNFAPLLVTIGLVLAVLFLFCLRFAGSLTDPGCFRTAFAGKGLTFDYLNLISHVLPGLMYPEKAKVSDKEEAEAGAHLQTSLWQDYPQLLLNNELAGLQVLEASRLLLPVPAGDDSNVSNAPELELQEEESAVFLKGKIMEPAREKPFTLEVEQPLLLIYHTHTSESFLPVSGKIYVTDPEENVVFLGAALAETLQEDYGIPVLHHLEVFDQPRSKAYQKACPAIEKILQQNPQIQVVLDLHRDGVSRKITTTNLAGQETARVLFVIETRHQGWSSNMRFALFLENMLQKRCQGFSRGILKNVYACYNQHLHPRSLIVEIGGHENSRDELLRAIPYLAEALAGVFE